MIYLSVKNWDRHQCKIKPDHRKEFIALHLAVLDDIEFQSLPPSAQALLVQCWLLRGRLDSNIPLDRDYLERKVGRCELEDLQWLIDEGWLIETEDKHPPKRKLPAPRKNYTKGGYSDDFEEWWGVYPKKVSKSDAFAAWNQVEEVRIPNEELIPKTQAYADKMKGSPKYIKHPAGWLRDRRWEDDLAVKVTTKERELNRRLDDEQIDHYAHPMWKQYVEGVIAGEIPVGFEAYIADK